MTVPDFPATWRSIKIEHLCSDVSSMDPRSNGEGEFLYIDISSVDSSHKVIGNVQKIPNKNTPSRARQIVHKDDVIVSTVRPSLNAVAIIPEELHQAICSTGFCVLRPNPEVIEPEYLFAWVRHPEFIQRLSRMAKGISYPAVSDRDVQKISIPLPTLPEQHEIVKILRQADRLRQLRTEADQQSESLALAIFNDVFGFIDKNAFRQVRLGKISEIVSGVTKGRNLPAHETVNVPYLRVANVQAGYLDLSEIKTIDALPGDVEKYALQPGDVLLTEGGDFDKLGRGAIWEHDLLDCIHQNQVFRVRLDQETVLPLFFHYYLQSAYARHYFLRAAKRTTNLASINITQLAALPVPVPPLVMQKRFITAVNQVRAILTRQSKTVAEINQLAQAVMVHAFTGKLTQTFREQNHVTLTQFAHQRDEALKTSVRTPDLSTELTPRIARSFAREALSPAQQKLLAMIENQGAYVTGDYSEIADDLPPNEISRDLDLLKQIGLIKAVSVPVTPGQLGQLFFTKAYRALLPGDDARETDLSVLREAEGA